MNSDKRDGAAMSDANAITMCRPLPAPRCAGGAGGTGDVHVRVATAADVPFLDQLQKMHSHMGGWMPKKQLRKYIDDGHVLIAEEGSPSLEGRGQGGGCDDMSNSHDVRTSHPPTHPPTPSLKGGGNIPQRLGYVIARDQYMK